MIDLTDKKLPFDSYSEFHLPGNQKFFFKPLTMAQFENVVNTSVMYHMLSDEERKLPKEKQTAMVAARASTGNAPLSPKAFADVVRWMVSEGKMTVDRDTTVKWKLTFDEKGIDYSPKKGQEGTLIELAVKIICLGLMPPTLQTEGNPLGEINPYRAAFLNFLRKAALEDEEEE